MIWKDVLIWIKSPKTPLFIQNPLSKAPLLKIFHNCITSPENSGVYIQTPENGNSSQFFDFFSPLPQSLEFSSEVSTDPPIVTSALPRVTKCFGLDGNFGSFHLTLSKQGWERASGSGG